jgi:hypothetical protein
MSAGVHVPTPIDREKLLSLGIISKRTRDKIHEGRAHPETGKPFKAVTDELGATVTEHSAEGRAPGVSGRQDVNVRPKAVHLEMGVNG